MDVGKSLPKRAFSLWLFLFGGVGYGVCELLWRGYTHVTMIILGGLCFCVIFFAETRFYPLPFFMRCFFYGVFITSMELVCGSLVNTLLRLNVWDYSLIPFNLYGQICPRFFVFWVLLSALVIFLCKFIRRRLCPRLKF